MSRWLVDVRLVEKWLLSLDDDSYSQVLAGLEVLEQLGPGLGRPLADTLVGSRFKNMKELRPGSTGGSEIRRIIFAFDPQRVAILLVGGDKRGQWNKWYRRHVVIADQRYDEHLRSLSTRKDDK